MPPPKVCPRCGAQYENLKSTTCPQCFAKLVEVDEQTATALSEARAEVERTTEFQEAKAADDERFREQSFGACLSVALITLLTVVIAVVLIVGAVKRNREAQKGTPSVGAKSVASMPSGPRGPSLPALPVAAASLSDVLPTQVGEFTLLKEDQSVTLPGTQTPIFHAVYRVGPASGSRLAAKDIGEQINVYAMPAGLSTPQENNFTLGVTLSAQANIKKDAPVFFVTQYWHYAVIGSNQAASSYRDALLNQMKQ